MQQLPPVMLQLSPKQLQESLRQLRQEPLKFKFKQNISSEKQIFGYTVPLTLGMGQRIMHKGKYYFSKKDNFNMYNPPSFFFSLVVWPPTAQVWLPVKNLNR